MAFAEIAVQYDQDGIEIRFFNSPRVESHIIVSGVYVLRVPITIWTYSFLFLVC